MDMLQTVMRSSIDRARMASPLYSMTWPFAPPVPVRAIRASTRSLAVTPGARRPPTVTASVFGGQASRHCVARTCATSLVPMPKASAPKAPCVLVWLSPHTIVMPGCVRPSSGEMTCTMPCRSWPSGNSGMAAARQFSSSARTWAAACGSSITGRAPGGRGVVGVEWSMVATVRSGRRTPRPRSRRAWKAWGEVTSCTRCRST